jgi:glycosyltransferase involved in cell wall biosynthesis
VLPTFNRAALLERALASVRAQTRPACEVVVVDDGSSDDTAERMRRLRPWVRALFQRNRGAAAARNRGVRAVRADWVAFLDDDDVWAPDHLERVAAAIEATGGAAGFYFRDAERVRGEGSRQMQWEQAGLRLAGATELRADATDWAMLPTQPFMLQGAIFRRETLLAIGGLDETLLRRHDTDLFLRLSLGRSACAVAGAGVVISADDRTGQRLTERFDGRGRIYWDCTVRLYRKALDGSAALEARHRSELRRRVAAAHLARAKIAWSAGEPWAAGGDLGRALGQAPALVLRRLLRRARSVLGRGA